MISSFIINLFWGKSRSRKGNSKCSYQVHIYRLKCFCILSTERTLESSENINVSEEKKEIKTSIGGQALMEGIMMRGPKRTAMAVRNLQGEIVLEEWNTVSKKPKKIWTLPIFRGLYGMVASLTTGYKALMRSAVLSGLDELEAQEEEEKKLKKLNKARAKQGLPALEELPEEEKVEHTPSDAFSFAKKDEEVSEPAESVSESAGEGKTAQNADEKPAEKTKKEEKEKKSGSFNGLIAVVGIVGTVLGVALMFALFFYLPTQLYSWTIQGAVEKIEASYPQMLIRSLFEGVIRIILFVGYMAAVSLMKDIKRTFMYHGAEHKTIFCYEKGLPLTVENVRKMSRFHPRCGTSFMVVMLIIGILVGSLIPQFSFEIEILNNLLRTLCKLALLPVTVGIGYEFIKYAGKHDNLCIRILSAPGLLMQRISTKEPTDDMIECAIAAVEKVIPSDGSDKL